MQKFKLSLLVAVFAFGLAPSLKADIIIDYTHDTAGKGFFSTNTVAKAALEAAAKDVSDVLNLGGALGEIPNHVISGTNGSTTATATYRLSYTNPDKDIITSETWNSFTLATDEIRIFAGMRNLSGSTLGQGGPGGFGFSLAGGGFPSEWIGAVADMEANSNAILGRGHGPTIQTLSGGSSLGGVTANYSISRGATHGNLWFDSDTDNNSVLDSNAQLEAYWHFDHTTDVAAGKFDFYSVAVHEILHSIGFGGSETWDDLVNGTDWEGAFAIAENGGSGEDLIDGGGAHIASGTTSTSIVTGLTQDAVMTPSIAAGQRKHITLLDIAFLKDIGYTNAAPPAAVPEPGTLAMVSILSVCGIGLVRRRRNRTSEEIAA